MEGLERQVRSAWSGQGESPEGRMREQKSVFPTSAVQRQFWLLHQLAPEGAAYNIAYAFRLRGDLDCCSLRKSLEAIIDRHAVFRTTFAARANRLVQVVRGSQPIEVPVVDLSGFAAEEADDAVTEMVHAAAARPFDLSEGPLVRALLLRCSPEDHVFVVVMHHIITDLQSLRHFFGELTALYEAHVLGTPCPLERPSHHYSDYALWEQRWLGSEPAASMLSYWEQELRGCETLLALPTDRPRPAVQSQQGAEVALQLPAGLTTNLRRFSRHAAVPLFGILFSAYVVLLRRLSRQTSITVGVPFTNRRQSDFRDVMGCFVNILPIHVDVSGDVSFLEVARRVRQTMLAAHRCQEVTVESIVERLKLKRTLSCNPLYQVGFTYCPPIEFELPRVTIASLDAHPSSSQLDMFASLWESAKHIYGRIEFCTDLFDRTTVQQFVTHYETLLRSAIEDAERPVAALPIFSGAERVSQNGTDTLGVTTPQIHAESEKRPR